MMDLQEFKHQAKAINEKIAFLEKCKKDNLDAHTEYIHKELAKRGIKKGVCVKWGGNSGAFNRIEPMFCTSTNTMLYLIVYNPYTSTGRISKQERKDVLLGQDEKALNEIQIYNESW